MIKECKVLINNDAVTVVDFDGHEIQIPAIHKAADTVKIALENGRYKLVDDNRKVDPVVEDKEELTVEEVKEAIEEEVKEETPVENKQFKYGKKATFRENKKEEGFSHDKWD